MSYRRLLVHLAAIVLVVGCAASSTVDTGLTGTMLAERVDETGRAQIFRLDLADGSQEQISAARTGPGSVSPRESPDGSAVLYAEFRDDLGKVVIMVNPDGDQGAMVISDTSADEAVPTWSSDCRSLFFARFTGAGNGSIWRMNSDGSGREIHFASSGGVATGPDQSLHHDRLLFHSSHESNSDDASIYSIEIGPGEPVRVTPAGMNARWGRWSPTADQLVFEEWNADGSQSRVSIIDGDGTNLRTLTEFEDDIRIPVWSPNGEWIAFRRADLTMVAANVETGRQVNLGIEEGGLVGDWGPHGRTCPVAPGGSQQP